MNRLKIDYGFDELNESFESLSRVMSKEEFNQYVMNFNSGHGDLLDEEDEYEELYTMEEEFSISSLD